MNIISAKSSRQYANNTTTRRVKLYNTFETEWGTLINLKRKVPDIPNIINHFKIKKNIGHKMQDRILSTNKKM